MIYRLWRIARALVGAVPLRVSYVGADLLALVAWAGMPIQRRNAAENMRRVVDPARAGAAARRSFQNYARYLVDFLRHDRMSAMELIDALDFNDWHVVDEMLARGRGCILVLMHFGNWDAGAGALALRGYRLNVIAETQGDERLNRDLVRSRTGLGVTLIPMERAATGIVRAMRRNEVLAILLDRPLEQGGVEVEFFGATTRVPEGPARIALRTGAAVLPVGLVRVRRNQDGVRPLFDNVLIPQRTGDDDHDVRRLTQAIMSAHERIIRRAPTQWYMFRRMWPAHHLPRPETAAAATRA